MDGNANVTRALFLISWPRLGVISVLSGEGDIGVAAPTPGGDVPPKRSGRDAEIGRGKAGQATSDLLSCAWGLVWPVSLILSIA